MRSVNARIVVDGLHQLKGAPYYPLALYTYGQVKLQVLHMRARPFDSETNRLESCCVALMR